MSAPRADHNPEVPEICRLEKREKIANAAIICPTAWPPFLRSASGIAANCFIASAALETAFTKSHAPAAANAMPRQILTNFIVASLANIESLIVTVIRDLRAPKGPSLILFPGVVFQDKLVNILNRSLRRLKPAKAPAIIAIALPTDSNLSAGISERTHIDPAISNIANAKSASVEILSSL